MAEYKHTVDDSMVTLICVNFPIGQLDGFRLKLTNTGNVQGLGANQIGACIMDGPKSIRNMSEISEVSELSPKFEYCFYRNIANF